MDNGFNDDELADIMSEIENLEQDFSASSAVKTEDINETASEEAFSDAEMNSVVNELSEMDVEDISGENTNAHDDNLHHMDRVEEEEISKTSQEKSQRHSSMNFNVEGDMKLDLSFQVSGKFVNLQIDENGFQIELDGGMKFSIPIENDSDFKKSA